MKLEYLTIEEREKLRQDDPETYAQLAAEYLPSGVPMIRATNGRRDEVKDNLPARWVNGRLKIERDANN
jgi:hypothetical protein